MAILAKQNKNIVLKRLNNHVMDKKMKVYQSERIKNIFLFLETYGCFITWI